VKQTFCDEVELNREKKDPRFPSVRGDRFGFFRLSSPFTGATLRILVCSGEMHRDDGGPGEPWDHVSVSKIDNIPTWNEMAYVKGMFFGDDECVIQFHPPASQYVNIHPNVLHLWKPLNGTIPMPNIECV
jgi:hypothetical protein